MTTLADPTFWTRAKATIGTLQTDGSLKYILLDNSYQMRPLIRNTDTTFTDFAGSDPDAKKCAVIINGNMYSLDAMGKIGAVLQWAGLVSEDSPRNTQIQGKIVLDGKLIAGDSRPDLFWFGQVMGPTPRGWTYMAGRRDPPVNATIFSAVGGIGPLIIDDLRFGAGNQYRPGAPDGVGEPATNEPPAASRQYLIQRNNNTFVSANSGHPATGKTILAYCVRYETLLVAVQPHAALPGQTYIELTSNLVNLGFDSAVFLDGSDSAMLMVDHSLVVTPAPRKDATIDVGIGFYQ